jgi:hypothetical protein
MSRFATAVLLLVLARPDALIGQSAPVVVSAISPGARVRITQVGQKPRVAIMVAPRADTMMVRWGENTNVVAVPLADVSRLDVSTGRHRKLVRGAVVGTLSAGTAGLLLGAATYSPCKSTEMFGCFLAPASRGEQALIGGALGGALGLVVGTLTGVPRRDSWQQVPLHPRRVSIAVTPRGRATGLGVSLRF